MEHNEQGYPQDGIGRDAENTGLHPCGADRVTAQSGSGASYDAEPIAPPVNDTPVFDRGRTADLDRGDDDEDGTSSDAGIEAGSTHALSDDGEYGIDRSGADVATGLPDASILAQMGMGPGDASGSHGGFDDEDESGQPSAPGYDGDDGDAVAADGLSSAGASYGMTVEGSDDGLPSAEVGVGSGFANPEEPGLSSDEDTLIDEAAFDHAGGGGEIPAPSPGPDIPVPSRQPGYGDDGNDVEVEIPPSPGSDIPAPSPTFPGGGTVA